MRTARTSTSERCHQPGPPGGHGARSRRALAAWLVALPALGIGCGGTTVLSGGEGGSPATDFAGSGGDAPTAGSGASGTTDDGSAGAYSNGGAFDEAGGAVGVAGSSMAGGSFPTGGANTLPAGGATAVSGAGGTSPVGHCTVAKVVYPNGSTGIPAPDGCNTCSCLNGMLACTEKACSVTCGGLVGLKCPGPDQFCQFPVSKKCGNGDQTGTCAAPPQFCPGMYAPVCGCDGKTYVNDCDAARNRMSTLHAGACEKPIPPSCIVNGKGYENGASVTLDGGCACTCNAGALSCPSCTPKACGAQAGNTCSKTEYCAYTDGQYCGAADAQATCKLRPSACTQEYAPVCGCDGKTYGNACTAASAGTGVNYVGKCAG